MFVKLYTSVRITVDSYRIQTFESATSPRDNLIIHKAVYYHLYLLIVKTLRVENEHARTPLSGHAACIVNGPMLITVVLASKV